MSFGLCALLLAGTPGVAVETEFPFERELLLEIDPLPGSRQVPSLEVEKNGSAEIDLWCARAHAQVAVSGQTIAITIVPGAAQTRPCTPDQARGDDDLLAALTQATRWQREDDLLILVGPQTLRFRLSTH